MGRINIVLGDDLEKLLRKRLGKNGFKKGDMSKYIQNLIITNLNLEKIKKSKK